MMHIPVSAMSTVLYAHQDTQARQISHARARNMRRSNIYSACKLHSANKLPHVCTEQPVKMHTTLHIADPGVHRKSKHEKRGRTCERGMIHE